MATRECPVCTCTFEHPLDPLEWHSDPLPTCDSGCKAFSKFLRSIWTDALFEEHARLVQAELNEGKSPTCA